MLSTLLIALSVVAAGQLNTRVFSEKKAKGFKVYVSNNEFCPVSLLVNFRAENLVSSRGSQKIFVIPANTEKFLLTELNARDSTKRYSYSLEYQANYGDVNIQQYDKDYPYDLPYPKGKAFIVSQGYNGIFSHQNTNAIDFTMPEGTPILAAREGTVIKIEIRNTQSCSTEDCQKYNNYVMIMHPDGTIAVYNHIKYNGTTLKPGDKVVKGDVIAASGNTGWTNGPHLHFACFLPGIEKRQSIPTRFRVDNGNSFVYLKENDLYTRTY